MKRSWTLHPFFERAVKYPLLSALSFFMLLSVWLFLSTPLPRLTARTQPLVSPLFLPPIGKVLSDFLSPGIFSHLTISIFRTLTGVAIAAILALILALIISASQTAEALVVPLSGLRYIPTPAFVPLTMLWVGIGEPQKLLIIGLGVFLQALPLYVGALRSVEQNFIDIGSVYGLSRLQIACRIRLLRALPAIYDSTRIVFGIGWACLLTAEIVGATRGLGFLITQSQRYLQTDVVFAAMTWVGLVGLLFDWSLIRLRCEAFPWDRHIFSDAANQ